MKMNFPDEIVKGAPLYYKEHGIRRRLGSGLQFSFLFRNCFGTLFDKNRACAWFVH